VLGQRFIDFAMPWHGLLLTGSWIEIDIVTAAMSK
jgi:hypothetical protein